MALRSEVVHFIRSYLFDNPDHAAGVSHISIMQKETASLGMPILNQVIDSLCVERGSAALNPVHLVTLLQKEFGEVCAILSCHTGDQCALRHHASPPYYYRRQHSGRFLKIGCLHVLLCEGAQRSKSPGRRRKPDRPRRWTKRSPPRPTSS